MKKNVVYVSIAVAFVLLFLFGIEIFINSSSTQEIDNEETKNFYFYDVNNEYFYEQKQDVELTNIYMYTCQNENCEILSSQRKTTPYFLLYDGTYIVLDLLNQKVKEIDLANYTTIVDVDNYALLVKKINEYTNEYQNFDIYNYLNNEIMYLDNNEEHGVTILTNYTDYYVLRNLDNDGPSLDIQGNDIIFDKDFNLISTNYFVYGKTVAGELIVDKIYEPFFGGGINTHGYTKLKSFSLLDSNHNISYTSKEYLSIQNFIYTNDTTISYFFAVDQDNILKLYDMEENSLANIEEWTDDKSVCVGEKIVLENDNFLTFLIGNGEENAKEYTYSFNTKELIVKELDYHACTT